MRRKPIHSGLLNLILLLTLASSPLSGKEILADPPATSGGLPLVLLLAGVVLTLGAILKLALRIEEALFQRRYGHHQPDR